MARRSDDAVLVELARRGGRDAVERLFDRCWPVAWRAAYAVTLDHALAEDVAQEALQRVLRGLDTFDETRPLEPWVRRIAVNRALDELRRDRRLAARQEASSARQRPRWSEDATPEELALTEAVARLGEPKRLVVVLHYWLDYTAEDIGAILDLPVGTVTSRLSRARAQLRKAIEEETNAA
jgi:RNA polymerase sigma-70 factor, ECF subfamily